MSLPKSVEAVRNERTEKYFIVLDWDVGDKKIKVINPTGDVLDVIKLIFKMDDPVKVDGSEFAKFFSEKQIYKLEHWEQDQIASDEKKRLEKSAKASRKKPVLRSSVAKPRKKSVRTEGMIEKKSASAARKPIAQWSATELTFYRHHIEKLKPNEAFSVLMDGQGTFQITKAEFQRVFNNVVMNADYCKEGVFRYAEIPDEAKAFIKAPL